MRKLLIAVCLLLTIQATAQVEKIRIIDVRHDEQGITSYSAKYHVQLPANLTGIAHAKDIVNAYKGVYRIESLDTINNTVYAVFVIPAQPLGLYRVVDNITTEQLNEPDDYYAPLIEQYNELVQGLSAFQLLPSDAIIGKVLINTTWQDAQ